MKLPGSITKLLENKYVLYIVFFLAVTNVLGYLVMGNYKAAALFILIGFLVSNFNKNMVIILGIPLLLTSIFFTGFMREGVENMDDSKPEDSKLEADKKDSKGADKKSDKKVAVDSKTGVAVVPKTDSKETDENGNPVPKANDEPFTTVYNKKNNRVDYASTVEDAYGDLNKILGGDGIKNLTADTQKLMEQQLQLANAMKSMTPLLDQAKSLMNGFDMKNFGNIAEMAKQFKGEN